MRWKYVESGEGIERVYQVPVLVLEFLVESGEGIERRPGYFTRDRAGRLVESGEGIEREQFEKLNLKIGTHVESGEGIESQEAPPSSSSDAYLCGIR